MGRCHNVGGPWSGRTRDMLVSTLFSLYPSARADDLYVIRRVLRKEVPIGGRALVLVIRFVVGDFHTVALETESLWRQVPFLLSGGRASVSEISG